MPGISAATGQEVVVVRHRVAADAREVSVTQADVFVHSGLGFAQVKADNIVMLRRNIESDIDAIDKEVERLNELKRAKKNSVSQISDYLRRNMEAAAIKSIKRPLFTITLALAPEK